MVTLDLVCVVKRIKANENKLPLVTDGCLGRTLVFLFSFAYDVLQLKAAEMHSQTLKRVNGAPPGGQNHV